MSGYRKLDLDVEMRKLGLSPAHPAQAAHTLFENSRMSSCGDPLGSTAREDQQSGAPRPRQRRSAKLANVAKDMDAVRSMSNLSTGESSRTHAPESDAVLACQHSEWRSLDGQMVCATCGEILGESPAAQSPQPATGPASDEAPQRALESEPGVFHMWSTLLQTDIWVCDSNVQARILRAEGTPAYSSKELRLLGRLKARDAEAFPAKLQTIHQIKQVFGGTLDALE
jgi:hypothetical protein